MLEQHFLKRGRVPGLMVPTNPVSDLLYLEHPEVSLNDFEQRASALAKITSKSISHGY